MFKFTMIGFHKKAACPTSQELMDFQAKKLSSSKLEEIRKHIYTCDFCGAEVEFYSHCPKVSPEENVSVTEIPKPLYELAEALLKGKHKDDMFLNKLHNENEGLITLQEA